jgi:serine/threonine-protein kinase
MTQEGRYTILREIASGATATVFLAEDSVLRRKVALKKLHPHLLNRPDMVKRFQKEAVAVASLSHENVIKIFDYGQEEGAFLAMEFIDGVSLESLLALADGVIPNLAAVSLFHQLLEGMAAAHARGICHRDIKPSNVLIDRKGMVRLADFGIAFLSEETALTRTGAYLGTPGYSSPEQAEGNTVTDVFAAGILLYRCLTGKPPFAAGSPHATLKAIVEKTPAWANLVNPRLLPGLADLARDMLAKDPGQRPSAGACARRLADMAARFGFPIEAGRLAGLLEAPSAAAAKETREIAARLLEQARALGRAGKGREALKLYSLVQVFASDSEAGREAQRSLRSGVLRARFLAAAAGAALAGGALALWPLLRTRPAQAPLPARVSLPAVPERTLRAAPAVLPPAPAPAAPTRDLAPPAAPPDRPRPGRSNRNVTYAAPKREVRPAATAAPPAAVPDPAPSPAAARAEARGWLWVKTTPPFAQVRIDGRESGATPWDAPLPLPDGAHRLRVEHEGCKPIDQAVPIRAGDTLTVRLSLERDGSAP